MKIGELAARSGLAPSKIRFLEARGLLGKVSRHANGYRDYDADALTLLRIIGSAQQAGFSLDEIQRVLPDDLGHWEHDGLIEALEAKIADIEAMEQRLAANKRAVLDLIHQIRTKPEGMDCAENAQRIIGKIEDTATARSRKREKRAAAPRQTP